MRAGTDKHLVCGAAVETHGPHDSERRHGLMAFRLQIFNLNLLRITPPSPAVWTIDEKPRFPSYPLLRNALFSGQMQGIFAPCSPGRTLGHGR